VIFMSEKHFKPTDEDKKLAKRAGLALVAVATAVSATACLGHPNAAPKPKSAQATGLTVPEAIATPNPKAASLPLSEQYDLAYNYVDNTSSQTPTASSSPTAINIPSGITNSALRQLVIEAKNEGLADAMLIDDSSALLSAAIAIPAQVSLITDSTLHTTRLDLAQTSYANYVSDLVIDQPDNEQVESQLLEAFLGDSRQYQTYNTDIEQYTNLFQTVENDQINGVDDTAQLAQLQHVAQAASQEEVQTNQFVDTVYDQLLNKIEEHSPLYQASPTVGP
jgi:hypothetical protein